MMPPEVKAFEGVFLPKYSIGGFKGQRLLQDAITKVYEVLLSNLQSCYGIYPDFCEDCVKRCYGKNRAIFAAEKEVG